MKKLQIKSKSHVPWVRDNLPEQPYLEVEVFEEEIVIDIQKVDQAAKELYSECIFVSREDGLKLGKWLLENCS